MMEVTFKKVSPEFLKSCISLANIPLKLFWLEVFPWVKYLSWLACFLSIACPWPCLPFLSALLLALAPSGPCFDGPPYKVKKKKLIMSLHYGQYYYSIEQMQIYWNFLVSYNLIYSKQTWSNICFKEQREKRGIYKKTNPNTHQSNTIVCPIATAPKCICKTFA